MEENKMIPVLDVSGTGKNIDRLRRDAGLSVRDMQIALGFGTPNAIYKWLRGKCMPSLDSLVVLSALLGVAIDDIIEVEWIGG